MTPPDQYGPPAAAQGRGLTVEFQRVDPEPDVWLVAYQPAARSHCEVIGHTQAPYLGKFAYRTVAH